MKLLQKTVFFLLIIIAYQSFAEPVSFTSKDKKSTVIELFTSQGCSSCPSAEAYINAYIDNKDLWSKYIPIVFHVDYWDYIGWKDVFAQSQFTSRQYLYAKLKHVRTVYTPAFIVNGSAWRRGFFNSTPNANGLDNGVLDITVNGKKVVATFKMTASNIVRNNAMPLNLNIAVLGMDMVVDITAGENEGRLAKHNFVVLGYSSLLSDKSSWNMQLPVFKSVKSARYAFVSWISTQSDPTPLQAVGGWLP